MVGWTSGFSLGEGRLNDDLYGRVTLDILSVDCPLKEAQKGVHEALKTFLPKEC
jgi:hypothetical protein